MGKPTREARYAAAVALEYGSSAVPYADEGVFPIWTNMPERRQLRKVTDAIDKARAEGAAAALADPEKVLPAFEALCKAEGARTITIACDHGKVKVYLNGQPSLLAASRYELKKREEARRG